MRVLISSVGTRGDVQPALALALQLRELGHEARLCVPPNFVSWAQELGFAASPVGVEMRAPRPGETRTPIPDLITDQFEKVGAAAEGCDLLVGAGLHQYAMRSLAERRGVRCVVAAYAPISLAAADDAQERGRWNARSLERVNANRGRLGLPPVDDVLDHILGEEPWLAADPFLGPAERARVVQTGAWLLPDVRPLPPALEAFLADGEAPVYVGLGSMPAAPGVARTLIEAARAAGRRVILARGWAELDLTDAAADAMAVDDVSHAALFPHVAAVVHHGGAGTTTAAALAGAPQVATPMFGDQFYWGGRIEALGLGVALPFAGLSPDALAAALTAALRPESAARAKAAAGQVTLGGAAAAARCLSEA